MNSLKYLIFLVLTFLTFPLTAAKPTVLVTIAPYRFFVEKIAGDTLQVQVLVPPAASSHTFEPTPKDTLKASRSEIWFIMGEPFETRALNAFKAHNPELQVVDLRENIELIFSTHACCAHSHCQQNKESADLHLWLSPKNAKIQATTIAGQLIKTYPENEKLYKTNLNIFLNELSDLDQKIKDTLSPLKNRAFMVSHPAYAYFCRDYELTQLSIEFEGKDPTPKQLTEILYAANQYDIKTIFTQKQYSSKGAKLIAKNLNAKVIELDPYSADYFNSMLQIAIHFAQK